MLEQRLRFKRQYTHKEWLEGEQLPVWGYDGLTQDPVNWDERINGRVDQQS